MPNTTLSRIGSAVRIGRRKEEIAQSVDVDSAQALKRYSEGHPLPAIPSWDDLITIWVPTILKSCNYPKAMDAIYTLLEYRALLTPEKSWEPALLALSENENDWIRFLQPTIIKAILASDDQSVLEAVENILELRDAQRGL